MLLDAVNAFYATKTDEGAMIFDRVVMTTLQAKISGAELAVN